MKIQVMVAPFCAIFVWLGCSISLAQPQMKLKPFTAGDWTGTENAWQHADDADPACLTFSLKGITAALKMVCPKR